LGVQFGALLAGAIVTETIFSWPGIGHLTLGAISNRYYHLVQGRILAIGMTYVAVNFLSDRRRPYRNVHSIMVTSNLAIPSQLAHHVQGGGNRALREENERKSLVL
jgi:hypothetical protein